MEKTELKSFERIYHSSVTWRIRNYFRSIVSVNTAILSPVFVTNLRGHIKWQLSLIPRQTYEGGYVTKFILRRSTYCNGPRHIVVKVRLALSDCSGNYWTDITEEFCFYRTTAVVVRGWDIYDMEENAARSTKFFAGNITVFCTILQDFPLHFRQSDADEDLWALSNDLKVFYMCGNLTDLDLKVNEKTFSVHSAIVNARCHKVARSLEKYPHIRKIDLTNFTPIQLINGLIVYWYSGEMEKLPKISCSSISNCIEFMEHLELRPFVDPELLEMSTTFKSSDRYINWVIDDIEFCAQLKHLDRKVDYVYKCEDLPWKLHIYPKGIRGDADFFTMIVIEEDCVLRNTGYIEIFFRSTGMSCYSSRLLGRLNKPGIYVFTKCISHEHFSYVRDMLLRHNNLQVTCKITYSTGYSKQSIETIQPVEDFPLRTQHPYINLANDMKLLLKTEDLSDVSLKSGDKIFKVHSAVLAARSRYFESLFINREYDTSKSDIITLDDVEPDDLERILKYVYYAEKIVLNSDLALRLYPVFNKYKITRLENACSDYLQDNISVDNVFRIIELAKKFNVAPLKRTALQFVQENFDQIQNLEFDL